MPRGLRILTLRGDRCCRAAWKKPEAGAGWPVAGSDGRNRMRNRTRLPVPAPEPESATGYELPRVNTRNRPVWHLNAAALSRTARILLDTPAIPKYTFAPLTAGEIVVPRDRDHLTRRNRRISDENPALA